MNEGSENFATPVQTRSKCLGLRRSSLKKESAASNKGTSTTPQELARSNSRKTPASTSKTAKACTDARITYGSDHNRHNSTPETPTTPSLKRECVSTNCRPYRLSLSKRIREKMTKKRLEFHLANELEKEEEDLRKSQEEDRKEKLKEESNEKEKHLCQEAEILQALEEYEKAKEMISIQQESDILEPQETNAEEHPKPEDMTRKEILERIEEMRKDLKAREEHARKVEELQQAIDTWKVGFSQALKDLRERITPQYDNETLLEHLRIPKEMLKYIND